MRELLWLSKQDIPYVWGGADIKGADCSGYIFLAAKRAGLPVRRTTSKLMRDGLHGWEGTDIEHHTGDSGDLIFWTWSEKPTRIHGHVGAIVVGASGLLEVAHASTRRGRVVVVPLTGKLQTDISAMRRMKW